MKKKTQIPAFESVNPRSHFLASEDGLRTYKDLYTFKTSFLNWLFENDINPERPLPILADTSDEVIFIIAACWELGIPFISLNADATRSELDSFLDPVDFSSIIVDNAHKKEVPSELALNLEELDLDQILNSDEKPIESSEASNFKPRLDPEQIFGYFFTSGTTGKPKMVPLKRRQMLFAAHASASNFQPETNHFWLLCLPLNHIGGVSIILRSMLYGSAIYRMNNFDRDMVSTFLTENTLFQAASMVPTMLKRLLEIKAFSTHKNFKAILLGGGPVSTGLIEESIGKGIPLVPSYGMTETCAQIAANPILKPSGVYPPLKSVGTVFEPNELEIRDEEQNKLGVNNSGMIWLKGPQVFDGYNDPEANKNCFDEEGWFSTGDYGHLNGNGQLFIESRRSDLILTGGENVSPFEVENELMKISPIREAAVIGVPDDEWGEKVVAVVVSEEGVDINNKRIQNKLKERLTNYKIPKMIIKSDSIPRNSSGKVVKNELLKYFE